MVDLNANILTGHMVRLNEEREAEIEQRPRQPRPRSTRRRWRSGLSQALRRWAARLEPRGADAETAIAE